MKKKKTYNIEEIVKAFITAVVWVEIQTEVEKMPEWKELMKMYGNLTDKLVKQ